MASDQTTHRSTDAAEQTGDVRESSGGTGGQPDIAEAKRRMLAHLTECVDPAGELLKKSLKAGKHERGADGRIRLAQWVADVVLDRVSAVPEGKPSKVEKPRAATDIAEASERLRLLKQAERRGR